MIYKMFLRWFFFFFNIQGVLCIETNMYTAFHLETDVLDKIIYICICLPVWKLVLK